MRIAVLLTILLGTAPASAEVYKCTGKFGKATYQASPCETSTTEEQLDIKPDPKKEAEAKTKLEAVRSEYETRKQEQTKIENTGAQQQGESTD